MIKIYCDLCKEEITEPFYNWYDLKTKKLGNIRIQFNQRLSPDDDWEQKHYCKRCIEEALKEPLGG